MHYHWSDCAKCGCHVSINYTAYPDRVSGSVRRWSADRSTNDGRPFEIPLKAGDPEVRRAPGSALAPDGGFTTSCVCGQEILVTSQAVGGEREEGLRVKLESS